MEAKDISHIKHRLKVWNKFPANAEADLDCLVNEVVVALEEGFGTFELAAVIQNEFVNHIGEPGPDEEVGQVADELSIWWGSKTA